MGYVPLDKRAYFVPEVLDGMEQLALVCIDNIECIAGDEEWEMAIFNLYNRIHGNRPHPFVHHRGSPAASAEPALTGSGFAHGLGQIWLQPLSDEKNCWRCSCAANCAASSCRKTWAASC